MGGGAHNSGVVRRWILRPGEEVIMSFEWAALRVLSLVWPIVIVYVVEAFAKIACEAISIIQVRLISVHLIFCWQLLFVRG
jgi:hypothetical protein